MKKEYKLEGMSCEGCVSNVKKSLLSIPGVTEAEVKLHPQGAVITMNQAIGVEEIQAQLNKAGRYSITEVI